MKVINLTEKAVGNDVSAVKLGDACCIMASPQEFEQIKGRLAIQGQSYSAGISLNRDIRLESHPGYDFLSFVYFNLQDGKFCFELVNLYYSSKFLVVVAKTDGYFAPVWEDFAEESLQWLPPYEKLTYWYYKLLDNTFTLMFEAMCRYEDTLAGIENDILLQRDEFDFERIIALKNNSFDVKKNLRLLLYVGDQLVVNDNGLLPEDAMRYFRNIDMHINRMYEYAQNLHELSGHLMDLYNSQVNSRTNDLINKLTIFTVFATPLTVLTGIYGMNFVNMPELQHEYGYFILLAIMGGILLTTYLILKKIKLL